METTRYRGRRIRWGRVTAALIFLICLIFLIGYGVSSCGKDPIASTPPKQENSADASGNQNLAGDPTGTAPNADEDTYVIGGQSASSTTETTTTPANALPDDYTESLQIAADVYSGNLVLVDEENPSHLTKDDLDLVLVARNGEYEANYSGIYNVSYPAYVLCNKEALSSFNKMISAYHAATNNTEIMFNYGYLDRDDSKSNPESASGLDIQLHLKTNSGSYSFISNTGDYAWIYENMHKYGFVLRYPEDKTEKTGEKGTYSALRYVGVPHAAYMREQNLCLEEYHELLKNSYAYDKEVLEYTYNEQTYRIYYVAASNTGDTSVPVPSDGNYTISGNNVDGYVVTAIS